MRKAVWIAVLMVVVVAVAGIWWRRNGDAPVPGQAISAESLRNMYYRSEGTRSGRVLVTDGRYEDPEGHVWVTMLDNIAWGDVTGDGKSEAVVVLGTNTGGSGVFHSLALVADVEGVPSNIAIAQLGDRIKLKGLSIEDGDVTVEMVTHGPGDPMCCPTKPVTRVYRYDGAALQLERQIPPEAEPADSTS